MYNWQSFRHIHTIIMYTISLRIYWRFPLALYLPLLIPFCSLSRFPLLSWNPPCCDRIRPPWSQVARKLIFSFPSLPICSPSVSHSEIPTPCGFPKLMRPLLRRHRNSGFQDQHTPLAMSSSLVL
jgi:hypothetical protein